MRIIFDLLLAVVAFPAAIYAYYIYGAPPVADFVFAFNPGMLWHPAIDLFVIMALPALIILSVESSLMHHMVGVFVTILVLAAAYAFPQYVPVERPAMVDQAIPYYHYQVGEYYAAQGDFENADHAFKQVEPEQFTQVASDDWKMKANMYARIQGYYKDILVDGFRTPKYNELRTVEDSDLIKHQLILLKEGLKIVAFNNPAAQLMKSMKNAVQDLLRSK